MASYIFLGLFTKSKVGATPANSPTIDIVNIDTNTLVVTGGSPSVISAMTGLYSYTYTGASGLRLVGLFKTSDTTVDRRIRLFGDFKLYDLDLSDLYPNKILSFAPLHMETIKINGATKLSGIDFMQMVDKRIIKYAFLIQSNVSKIF